MRKSVLNIIMTAVALAVLTGCSGDGYTPELLAIDTLMSEKPDSALRLLDSLSAGVERWPRSQRMRHSLLTMKARNKAYVPFTSDSLANDLVSYYDCHGTPNDRLLAHYLLGCVYRDINEAPLAGAQKGQALLRPLTSKLRNFKSGIMDRRMLTQMICRLFGYYHTGVSGCPYLTPVFEGLRLIMATKHAFSFSICSAGIHSKQTE